MITNRKAQAFVFVFLGTVATGQAQAAEGFTSKVEAQTIANAAGGVKAKAQNEPRRFLRPSEGFLGSQG